MENGRLTLGLAGSTLPYGDMFRAPLEVSSARALTWRYNDRGWELASQGLDVKAKSLWVNGDFRYQQPAKGDPWLNILAGIRLYDGADAWRYFPEPLMGKHLVDYLSGAIQGGQVDNATLIYSGDPQHFPYRKTRGSLKSSCRCARHLPVPTGLAGADRFGDRPRLRQRGAVDAGAANPVG